MVHFKRKHGVRTAVFAVLIVLGGAGIATAYALQSDSSSSVTAADSPSPLIRHLAADPNLPADKRAALNANAQAEANASANPPPLVTVPTNTLPPTRPSGIQNDAGNGPFSGADFSASNAYQGPVGSTWYLVFAGELTPYSHGVGGLEVFSGPANEAQGEATHFIGEFPFAGSSKLTIAAVNGSTLSLTDTSGATETFDLANMPAPGRTAPDTPSTMIPG
jgi:hypothetical protein